MNRNRFLRLVLFLLLAATPLMAQEQTASIIGSVTDPSGAVLPGVTVEAVRTPGGNRFSTQTDAGGNFRFASIPSGTYTVTATLSGMEPASIRNVEARLGTSPRVDLKLGLSAVSETISVTAEAPVVDVTTSATATSIRAESFERLPRGRDFTSIVTQAASASNESKGGGISIDGATALENRFIVDGVDTTDPQNGGTGKRVITDVVEEVQVKSAGYEAEFGGATGGVINVVTKSGTNDFSGTVTGYIRDRGWNGAERPALQNNTTGTAPEYFTANEDEQTIIEPGFTIGGPIVRDRIWFFGAYHPSYNEVDRSVTNAAGQTFEFAQTTDQDNIVANINGNIGTRALFKVTANMTGGETENPTLPNRNGRTVPSAASAANFQTGQTDIGENDAYSGFFDFIPTPMWYLSARGGQMKTNFYQEGISTARYDWFWQGSPTVFPDAPAGSPAQGFISVPTNSATQYDKFERNNFSFESSVFPTFAGSHNIKAGVQWETVTNDVLAGNQNTVYRYQWNRNDNFFGQRGPYGAVGVYLFQTLGEVESENTAVFVQDSWNTMNNRLTLNLGVRAERERIPDYDGVGEPFAIEFDWDEKIAPRFGFAYDLFGNARTKVYGSYGRFYDITKLDLARGSFGGDKWVWHAFGLNTPDYKQVNCTGVSNDHSAPPPTCSNATYLGSIDLRHPSTDAIDPDLKPMTSQEYTIGAQHELGNNMAVGVRYVHKELLRAIEDLGTLIALPNGGFAESYTIGNPGFGLSTTATADIPGFPKAVRDYDGLELEFTKRFLNRWGLHASYLYSRLYGNYSGLASSDEAQFGVGRTDPNVARWGDVVSSLFDASGSKEPVEGRLATDRPHQFKAQLSYAFPWNTTLGVNQYVGSGTPVSTQMLHHGVEFFPFGRGDLGRTPTLTQTDLFVAHRFAFGGRYGFEVSANVLNLFDEDTATAVYQLSNSGSVPQTDAAFFKGFDARALQNTLAKDALFNQESQFQGAREVRLGLRFTF